MPLRGDLSNGKARFRSSECDAQNFLAPLLGGTKDTRIFPFFELPAELRDNVYVYLFLYPRPGVCVSRSREPNGFRELAVLRRSCNDEFESNDWEHAVFHASPGSTWSSPYRDRLLRTRTIADILSPLLVNR